MACPAVWEGTAAPVSYCLHGACAFHPPQRGPDQGGIIRRRSREAAGAHGVGSAAFGCVGKLPRTSRLVSSLLSLVDGPEGLKTPTAGGVPTQTRARGPHSQLCRGSQNRRGNQLPCKYQKRGGK